MFNCNLEGFTGPNTCRMKIVTQNLSERISSTQHSCHIATSDHWRCSRRDASLSPALNVRASNDAVLQYTFCMFKQGWRHISEFCINFAIILITKFYGPLMTLWSYLLCVRFDTWVCTLLYHGNELSQTVNLTAFNLPNVRDYDRMKKPKYLF